MDKPTTVDIDQKKSVQWRLFEHEYELIFEGEEETRKEPSPTQVSIPLSDVLLFVHECKKDALKPFENAKLGSLMAVQKEGIDAMFDYLGKIVARARPSQELGWEVHRLLLFTDTLIGITAIGAYEDGCEHLTNFLKETLETQNLNEKFAALLSTYSKMRGKKVNEERVKIYLAMDKKRAKLEKISFPFRIVHELQAYNRSLKNKLSRSIIL